MTEVSKDFMLAEYGYHLEEYRRSEQLGETRLSLFLTIVTAVLGGSGLIAVYSTKDSIWTPETWYILFFAYLATFLFGLLTLLRIIHRNIESTKNLHALNRIRRYFVDKDYDSLVPFLTYFPYDDQPQREWRWIHGGLAENVVLTNALLASITTFAFAEIKKKDFIIWHGILIAIFVFFILLYLQVLYVKWRYQDFMKEQQGKSKYPDPTKLNSKERIS
jgi:hypothetical protein